MSKTDKYLQQKLEEHLRLETLLTEISANFVNLPADQIDAEIEDAQRLTCEALDFDLPAVWQWPEGKTSYCGRKSGFRTCMRRLWAEAPDEAGMFWDGGPVFQR